MKTLRKSTSLLLAMIIMLSAICIVPISANAASFSPRLSAPDTSNKYYRHTSSGGVNECIHISGGSVLPNCVGYAWGRAYESTGKRPNLSKGNANTFYSTNKNGGYYSYGSTPKVGSVICWNGGNYGHVAFVEKVEGNNMTISESHYGGARFNTKSGTISSIQNRMSGFQGYIYVNGNINPTYDPQGVFDSVSSNSPNTITVRGWAFDRDNLSASLGIHVYVGGPAGSGAPGYAITANKSRPDVNNVYTGVGNNHGFEDTIKVSKTGNQTIYVYAINTAGGTNNPLIGTKTVNIKKDSTKPKISNITVSKLSSNGYKVTCEVSDESGISNVSFPTWTDKNSQDDLLWKNGNLSGNVATFYVSKKDHNNEGGLYHTHIYAHDNAGNVESAIVPSMVLSDTPKEVYSKEYNGNTYKLFNSDMSWKEAKNWCESQGGHLVTVTSQSEWNVVLDVLSKINYSRCWLGGEDTSGSWKWVTGEKFSFSAWRVNQPDGLAGEDYLGTLGDKDINCKEWNDYTENAEDIVGFVCEFEKKEETTAPTTKPTTAPTTKATTPTSKATEPTEKQTQPTTAKPTTEATEPKTTAPTTEATKATEPAEDTAIYFINTGNWSNVYCYYWAEDNKKLCSKFGEEAEYFCDDEEGYECYKVELPHEAEYVYFSNGLLKKTVDIELSSEYNLFVMTDLAEKSLLKSVYNVTQGVWGEEVVIPKTEITTKENSKTLYVKASYTLGETVSNPVGKTTYKSSKTSVATVSANGKVTAKKAGKAVITITNNGVTAKVEITVKKPTLNVTSKTLKKGGTYTLKINGQVGVASFSTTKKKVATVNASGKITAKKKGTAYIKVKTNGITLKCKVKVK